jgi:Skp family chaperone for outer membrane proteins
MIRRNAVLLLAFTTTQLIVPPALSAQNQCVVGKVAVVQVSAVLASIDRYTEKNDAMTVIFNSYRVDLSRLDGIIDSAARAYREKSALLSAAARQAELNKLDGQQAVIRQRIAALQQHVTQQRAGLLQPIENGVQAVIDSVRVDLKCMIIFDASAQAGIASVNKSLDLTQRVIDRIRATGDTAIFGPPRIVTERP